MASIEELNEQAQKLIEELSEKLAKLVSESAREALELSEEQMKLEQQVLQGLIDVGFKDSFHKALLIMSKLMGESDA